MKNTWNIAKVLQLLGTSSPRPSTEALSLDPTGGLPYLKHSKVLQLLGDLVNTSLPGLRPPYLITGALPLDPTGGLPYLKHSKVFQLLGDLVNTSLPGLRPPYLITGALPLDPNGDFRPPDSLCLLCFPTLPTALMKAWASRFHRVVETRQDDIEAGWLSI